MEYVCTGAVLKCTMGTSTTKLKATPKNVSLVGKDQANIADFVSMVNVPSFGRCRSLAYPPTAAATAANHGRLTPMPCVPGTCPFWTAVDRNSLVCGQPALLKAAKLSCTFGGIISIVSPGQNKEVKAGESIKETEVNHSSSEQEFSNSKTKICTTSNSDIPPISGVEKKWISSVDDIPDECLADFNVENDNFLFNILPIPFLSYLIGVNQFKNWNERFFKDVDELNSVHKTTFNLLLSKNNDGTYKLTKHQILAFEKRLKAAESLKDGFYFNGSTIIEDWRKELLMEFGLESITYKAAKIPDIPVYYSNKKNSGVKGYLIKGGKKNREEWGRNIEKSLNSSSVIHGIEEEIFGTMNQKMGIWEPNSKVQVMRAYLKIQEDIKLAQDRTKK